MKSLIIVLLSSSAFANPEITKTPVQTASNSEIECLMHFTELLKARDARAELTGVYKPDPSDEVIKRFNSFCRHGKPLAFLVPALRSAGYVHPEKELVGMMKEDDLVQALRKRLPELNRDEARKTASLLESFASKGDGKPIQLDQTAEAIR